MNGGGVKIVVVVEKTKIKKKDAGMAHNFKKKHERGWHQDGHRRRRRGPMQLHFRSIFLD